MLLLSFNTDSFRKTLTPLIKKNNKWLWFKLGNIWSKTHLKKNLLLHSAPTFDVTRLSHSFILGGTDLFIHHSKGINKTKKLIPNPICKKANTTIIQLTMDTRGLWMFLLISQKVWICIRKWKFAYRLYLFSFNSCTEAGVY